MPQFVPVEELFKGRHFDREIVVLCVRWYLSFKLSYRDLVALMGERGIGIAHTTILRWGQHYTPEFEKRWRRFALTVGGSWRMDETNIKVRGEWMYLYGAVDKAGKTVDFHLSRKRDGNAAKGFLRKAMKGQRTPTKITLDAYAASHRAVAEWKGNGELPKCVPVGTSKYLNNLIEQDHRRVKQRLRPMLGLKSLRTAAVVISGIELAEKIKKKQFQMSKLGGLTATMPEIWASCPGCITGTTFPPTAQNPLNLTQFRIRTRAVRTSPATRRLRTLSRHRPSPRWRIPISANLHNRQLICQIRFRFSGSAVGWNRIPIL
jgi:transposase-like protein